MGNGWMIHLKRQGGRVGVCKMIMVYRMKNRIASLWLVLLLTGCVEKGMFENIHVRPNVSLPLGSITASDSSLFELAGLQDKMEVGSDGVLTFVDSSTLTLSSAESEITPVALPDQQFAFSLDLASLAETGRWIELPAGQLSESFQLAGLDSGVSVDTISFRSGIFRVSVEGMEGYDPSELQVIVPNLLKNDQPVTLHAGESLMLGPDYLLVPETGNRITVTFEGRVPQMATLAGTLEMEPGEIDYLAGFFGHKEISRVTRTIQANELADFTRSAVYVRFDQAEVEFELNNEYNVPMMLVIESLQVDGRQIELKPGRGGRSIHVAPKGVTRVVVGNDATLSGDGLTQALTKNFSELEVTVSTWLNPSAEDLQDPAYVAPEHNSMAFDDTLGGAFVVRLPLNGVLDQIQFDQELEVDLGELDKQAVDYNNMSLVLLGKNRMPLKLSIEVSVREPGSDVSVPLFDEPVEFPASENNLPPDDPQFQPGVVDEQNQIVRSLSAEKIDLLFRSEKLYLKLSASTIDAEARKAVKIYSPADFEFRIVAGAEFDYTVNEK